MIYTRLQVSPSEAWLRDDIDGTAYFPRPDGNFHLQESGVLSFATLVVEGSTVPTRANLPARTASYGNALSSTPSGPANAATNSSAASLSFTSSPPLFRSVVVPRRTSPSFNLKVVKAEIIRKGRKIEFKGKQQTFIEIVDSTANVEHISGVVRRRWGSDYVIHMKKYRPKTELFAAAAWNKRGDLFQ